MDFEFIETHKPVNITAKKVLSKGIHYDPKIKDPRFNSDSPLKLQKINDSHLKNVNFVDFTGKTHGKFTIIGLVKEENNSKKDAVWLLKCQCGRYETRRTKSLKLRIKHKENLDIDMCTHCEDLEKLRIRASAKSQGYSFEEYANKIRPDRKSIKEIENEKS